MELFRIKKDIPFMRHALIFNAISALTFVAAVFFLFYKGLHLSIEFTGGTVMEVTYSTSQREGHVRAYGAGQYRQVAACGIRRPAGG
jgi:preprotein translocase subunit SecF